MIAACSEATYIMAIRPWIDKCRLNLLDATTGAPVNAAWDGGEFPFFNCSASRLSSYRRVPGTNRFVVLLDHDAVNCGMGEAPQRVPNSCIGEFEMPQFADVAAPVRIVSAVNASANALDLDGDKLFFGTADGKLMRLDNWARGSAGPATPKQVGSWDKPITAMSVRDGVAVVTSGSAVARIVLSGDAVVPAALSNPLGMSVAFVYGVEQRDGVIYAALRDYSAILRWNGTGMAVELVPREGPTGIDGFGPVAVQIIGDTLFVLMFNRRTVMTFGLDGKFRSDAVQFKSYSGEIDNFVVLGDDVPVPVVRCKSCGFFCGVDNGTVDFCPPNPQCADLRCAYPDDACKSTCNSRCPLGVAACAVASAAYPLDCSVTCKEPEGGFATGTNAINVFIAVTLVVDTDVGGLTDVAALQAFLRNLAASIDVTPGQLGRAVLRINSKDATKTDVEFEIYATESLSAFAVLSRMRQSLRDREPRFVALGITEIIGPNADPLTPSTTETDAAVLLEARLAMCVALAVNAIYSQSLH